MKESRLVPRASSSPSTTAAVVAVVASALLLHPGGPSVAEAFVAPRRHAAASRGGLCLGATRGSSLSSATSRLSSRGLLPLDPVATRPRPNVGVGEVFSGPSRPPTTTIPPARPRAGDARTRRRSKPATGRKTLGADSRGDSSYYGPTSLRTRNFRPQQKSPPPSSESQRGGGQKGGWLERLSSLSNAASLLCVVDCTLLPAATVVLPLLGIAAGPAGSELFHSIGHAVAIFFVMPVGCLAAATNYLSHRRLSFTLPSLFGLALVCLANASHTGPFLSHLPHDLLHSLHCGTLLHRATNIAGCALLLASNLLTRRWQEANDVACLGGRFCGRPDCRVEEESSESFFRWEQPRV